MPTNQDSGTFWELFSEFPTSTHRHFYMGVPGPPYRMVLVLVKLN